MYISTFQISTLCRLIHNYRIKTITLGNLYYMYLMIMIILVHDCKIFQCMVLSITHANDRSYINLICILQNSEIDLIYCFVASAIFQSCNGGDN